MFSAPHMQRAGFPEANQAMIFMVQQLPIREMI